MPRAGCIGDFRLELDGVLKSWAVPKGPSLDPGRSGSSMSDHPLDYGEFEGVIPKGEYGGGTVMLWDRGTWILLDPDPGRRTTGSSIHPQRRNCAATGPWCGWAGSRR
jgi:bifunctional non-homologous end joining protein LigD